MYNNNNSAPHADVEINSPEEFNEEQFFSGQSITVNSRVTCLNNVTFENCKIHITEFGEFLVGNDAVMKINSCEIIGDAVAELWAFTCFEDSSFIMENTVVTDVAKLVRSTPPESQWKFVRQKMRKLVISGCQINDVFRGVLANADNVTVFSSKFTLNGYNSEERIDWMFGQRSENQVEVKNCQFIYPGEAHFSFGFSEAGGNVYKNVFRGNICLGVADIKKCTFIDSDCCINGGGICVEECFFYNSEMLFKCNYGSMRIDKCIALNCGGSLAWLSGGSVLMNSRFVNTVCNGMSAYENAMLSVNCACTGKDTRKPIYISNVIFDGAYVQPGGYLVGTGDYVDRYFNPVTVENCKLRHIYIYNNNDDDAPYPINEYAPRDHFFGNRIDQVNVITVENCEGCDDCNTEGHEADPEYVKKLKDEIRKTMPLPDDFDF